ncbi:MAG: helix-turn-helix transcriptional regulator [Roseomonas sp.]|nr:helix-turn-helix transcriptional regulator [Roseomonas sp.]
MRRSHRDTQRLILQLRAWRDSLGFSRSQVVQMLAKLEGADGNIDQATLAKWESGETRITVEDFHLLAICYGINSAQLLSPPPNVMPTSAPKTRTITQAEIARRLIAIRDEIGVTNSELARRLEVTRTRFLHWISPTETANFPAEESMALLCDMLPGLTLDFIYRGKLDAVPYALALRLKAHLNCQSAEAENG